MKLSGAQAIIKVLLEQGVDTVFGYPGGQVIPLYNALYDALLAQCTDCSTSKVLSMRPTVMRGPAVRQASVSPLPVPARRISLRDWLRLIWTRCRWLRSQVRSLWLI